MTKINIIQKIKKELLTAERSRISGNEGRARVCARRAAGWAIQEHLRRQGEPFDSTNALDSIKFFATRDGLPEEISAVLRHLTIKLEKDSMNEEAYYPIQGVDLVQEAHWLAENLLDEKIDLNQ
jgi:hypothetical protein